MAFRSPTAFRTILALAIAQLTFLIAKRTLPLVGDYPALQHLQAGSCFTATPRAGVPPLQVPSGYLLSNFS